MLDQNRLSQLLERIRDGSYGYSQALQDIADAQLGEDVRAAMYAAVYIIYHYGSTSAAHASLNGRNDADQHPITAISGLSEHLSELQKQTEVLNTHIGEKTFSSGNALRSFVQAWSFDTPIAAAWYNSADNSVTWNKKGDSGISSPELSFSMDSNVRVEFDLDLSADDDDAYFSVYCGQTTKAADGYDELLNVKESGHYVVCFDPAYYPVYEGFEPKRIWFISHIENSDIVTASVKISNVRIYQNILVDNGYTGLLARDIIAAGSKQHSGSADNKYIIAPSGKRYVTQIKDDGAVISIPVVPSKSLFIGNSLLNGFSDGTGGTFGMAASDSQHDYYYLFNSAVRELNSDYVPAKMHGADWEACESAEAQSAWCNDVLLPRLSEDLDLVVIQLGDNVNTSAKQAVFADGVINLLRYIRTSCPKARVVWMGAWYQSQTRMDQMTAGCKKTGCEFVNIWDLRIPENESAVGNFYTKNDGTAVEITSSGVASHPGDKGMKEIANRLLFSLGITEAENHYL